MKNFLFCLLFLSDFFIPSLAAELSKSPDIIEFKNGAETEESFKKLGKISDQAGKTSEYNEFLQYAETSKEKFQFEQYYDVDVGSKERELMLNFNRCLDRRIQKGAANKIMHANATAIDTPQSKEHHKEIASLCKNNQGRKAEEMQLRRYKSVVESILGRSASKEVDYCGNITGFSVTENLCEDYIY